MIFFSLYLDILRNIAHFYRNCFINIIWYNNYMKLFIAIILLGFMSIIESTFALTTLKPSLTNQMKYQEEIAKKNAIQEKKYNNMMRLAEIRKKKNIMVTKVSPSIAKISVASSTIPTSNQAPIIKQNTTQIISNSLPSSIPGVDMTRVAESWFGLYNNYRSSLGLNSYSHDTRLDSSAHDWNMIFSASRWKNHHTRNSNDGYYNFSVIDKWFAARGINPKPVNGAKHTENVWYWYYSCNETDCTDELIASIQSTFNFFMSEKGKSYDAHYRSIINPYFTKMGFDIIVIPSEKSYYITVHYATSF